MQCRDWSPGIHYDAYTALAVFLCAKYTHIFMVGRAGEPQGSPGFIVTGKTNPVRLTTKLIGLSGGD
ncbi:TPA: ash family protein [Enterobacter hormaechei]|nr:ash family protein [Enterobacter hormaechei]HCR0892172.1 ash family protein [Enterobacter hormaechei]